MCLDAVSGTRKMTSDEVRAYGSFVVADVGFSLEAYSGVRRATLTPTDKWLKATFRGDRVTRNIKLYDSHGTAYRVGFHKTFTRAGAILYNADHSTRMSGFYIAKIIIPVKLRRVHTVGRQDGVKCYVADEMYVSRKSVERELRRIGIDLSDYPGGIL